MVSLVMLEVKLVRVCAAADTGATTQTATAITVRTARWQLDGLPRNIYSGFFSPTGCTVKKPCSEMSKKLPSISDVRVSA